MKHPLWWTAAAYCIAWAVAALMIRYEFHMGGCGVCLKYGDFCVCSSFEKNTEPYRAWVDDEMNEGNWKSILILGTFVISLPVILGVIFFISHVSNPLHRLRPCLADLLNRPSEE